MRWSLAVALVLASCGSTSNVTPTPAPTTPTLASRTPAATRTPAPTASPTPVPSPAASPSGSPTPIVRPSGAIHYVAIGASDTVGVGSLDPANGSWPSRLSALMPAERTYRNLGVSGTLAAQAQKEQLPVAIREQPTVVTVWLAVNDMNAQVTPQAYGATIAAILEALVQGTQARIFVGNVPDLRAVPIYAAVDPLVVLATTNAYNSAIAAAAAKAGGRVTLVDLFTGSADLTTQLTVAADGFHPSDAGYVLIAQRFAEAMRRSGIPLKPGP